MNRIAVLVVVVLVVVFVTVRLVGGDESRSSPVQLCGASGCVRMSSDAGHLVVDAFSNAITSRKVPPPAPFFRYEWHAAPAPHGRQAAYFVPSAAAMYWQGPGYNGTGSDGWFDLGAVARSIASVSRDVASFPAPRVRVRVGGKPADDPASYVRLVSLGTPTRARVNPLSRWLPIRILTRVASPWQTTMYVSRQKSLLLRYSIDAGVLNATVYAIPLRMANAVRARQSLR